MFALGLKPLVSLQVYISNIDQYRSFSPHLTVTVESLDCGRLVRVHAGEPLCTSGSRPEEMKEETSTANTIHEYYN
jgi:hypothetical protein